MPPSQQSQFSSIARSPSGNSYVKKYMKTSALILLFAALCVETVPGKDNSGGKLIVYNIISKDSDRAEDTAAKKPYGARFHIVDIEESASFIRPKWTKKTTTIPPDPAGKFPGGKVRVVFILTKEGHVIEPSILHSSNRLIDESALKTIKQWQSSPARLNGSPVNTLASEDFNIKGK
jgi:TonB family protein